MLIVSLFSDNHILPYYISSLFVVNLRVYAYVHGLAKTIY